MTESKKPGKQHKKLYNLPMHKRRKQVSATFSKALKKRHGKRNVPVKKGDKVKVMRGKHRGKTGKVVEIDLKKCTVGIEKLMIKKPDGSEKPAMISASNIQITDLDLSDKKRENALLKGKKIVKKEDKKEGSG